MPAQLDGELERLASAGRIGAIAPSFLLDKAIRQMEQTLADARGGGEIVQSLVRRTANGLEVTQPWDALATRLVNFPEASEFQF